MMQPVDKTDASNFSISLEEFDDGHTPGGTQVKTTVARYLNKQSSNFFAVFDNLLSEEWCDRAYDYAVNRMKPWGAYITTTDAQNASIDPEILWKNGDKEKAIALVAVRALIIGRGSPFVGKDLNNIHG